MLVSKLSKKNAICHIISTLVFVKPGIVAWQNNLYLHSILCFIVLISSIFYSSIVFFDKSYHVIILENDKIWSKMLILMNLFRYISNNNYDIKPIIFCGIAFTLYKCETNIKLYTLFHPCWRLFSAIGTYFIVR